MIRLGTKLRQFRGDHKLSQSEVAEFIGITQSAYNRKESDQSEFKANELLRLAELYKIPVHELFPDNSYVQVQENKDNSKYNGFNVYSSEKEAELLKEQNLILKENNTLLKSRIQELEIQLSALKKS